jgi:hypothetical protein
MQNTIADDALQHIKSLTSQTEKLARDFIWWNDLAVWLIVATAIVIGLSFLIGTLYAGASYIAGKKAKELTRVEGELKTAKEDQLTLDLREKDDQIAQANKQAALANSKAGEANKTAGELEAANLTLRGQVATLETQAVDAKKDVAALQRAATEALAKQQKVQSELAKQETLLAKQQERAANAELELERLKMQAGPRRINRGEFLKALDGQPKAPVEILYLRDDQESFEFAQEIENVLRMATWEVISRGPIPASGSESPTAMTVGGQPSGVTVVVHSVSEEEAESGQKRFTGKEWLRTPWTVLQHAFEQSTGESHASTNTGVPPGILRVVVAPKPVR